MGDVHKIISFFPKHSILAWIIHELATPTVDMNALPGVLGPRTLRRTVQVRLGFKPLRLPGGTFIFTVSQHQLMNYPG